LSASCVPRPGVPFSLRRRPGRPLLRPRPVGPCARPRRRLRRQVMAQIFGHGLHVRAVKAKLRGDLPIGEVQSHQIKAQYPHPQRLVMPRQHRAGGIVETPVARLAAITLPMRLLLVMAVPDDCCAAVARAAHALRPAMLANQRKALGIVQQRREVDQVGHSHMAQAPQPSWGASLAHEARDPRPLPLHPGSPPRNPIRASPEDKMVAAT
jgi:hypothetical protein